jgi:hypothetical protein
MGGTAHEAQSPPSAARPRREAGASAWSVAVDAVERYGPRLVGAVVPFALVLYLALEGGGYDTIVRSQVGITVWWLVLIGALIGVLPMARPSRAAWLGLGLLTLFLAWTALSVIWTESSERTFEEVARVAAYLGVLVLAVGIQRDDDSLRRTVTSVAAAIGVVAIIALLSRLQPEWFPSSDRVVRFLPTIEGRLTYPLDYWNGLAALLAIGTPMLLTVALNARRLFVQALAAAALPAVLLAGFFTFSRGGALEIGVAALVFFALYPRRLAALPTVATIVAGAALLIAAATQRDALEDDLRNAVAQQQGDEMLAVVLVVCAGVGLLRVALGLAERHALGPRVAVSRQATAVAAAATLFVGLGTALALGGASELSDAWDEFKSPESAGAGAERFGQATGAGRYQNWGSALDAYRTEPLTGIGPGTYEYWWARDAPLENFYVRDAHSLYLETLAELGIPGLVMILAFVLAALVVAIVRSLRGPPEQRRYIAGAAAAVAAFATAAAVDWSWELAVIPVAFLLVAGAIFATRPSPPAPEGDAGRGRGALGFRIVLGLAALPCLAVLLILTASVGAVRESQSEVRAEDLGSALESAQAAQDAQPYAATPILQEALVREAGGDLDGAAAAAQEATRAEATNWRIWLILSRIETARGNSSAAVEAYERARSLNPGSLLFVSQEVE